MQRAKRRPGRPPGSTRDTTRTNILRAARTCFAKKGFGIATNRDIAERAGVTAPAIYQYFDSKMELYVVAAREAVAEVALHMRTQAVREGSAVAALAAMVRTLLALHEKDPSLAAFLSALPGELQRHPELARHFRPDQSDVPKIMSEVVERAVARGELDAKDTRRVAEMFIACMMGMSQYAALVGHGRSVATAFAELLEGRLFARLPAGADGVDVARRARSRRVATKPLHLPRR
jgi:AcrR family transcriptional regulator